MQTSPHVRRTQRLCAISRNTNTTSSWNKLATHLKCHTLRRANKHRNCSNITWMRNNRMIQMQPPIPRKSIRGNQPVEPVTNSTRTSNARTRTRPQIGGPAIIIQFQGRINC
ncbi:Hypothetical protein ROUS_23 [Brevibacterium phage Rousseau]|nr:Hypothetical protein ROUS_23 [Brevibacterium phage Rousseau]